MAPRHQLTRLDIELLRLLTRAGYIRPDACVGHLGASPWGIRKSFRRLQDDRLVRAVPVALDLHDSHGVLRATVATVWTATGRGARILDPHVVPGTDAHVQLGAPKVSRSMAQHTVGASALAAAYRRAGFQVAFERDIRTLEQPSAIGGRPVQTVSAWTVQVGIGMRGVRPPDLGLVDPAGTRWACELERTTNRKAADYRDIVMAWHAAGLGQVWHVQREKAWRELIAGVQAAGLQWGPSPAPGVNMTVDGRVRVTGWAPGRILAGPASWAWEQNSTTRPPAGFRTPTEPFVLDSWRQGTVVDPHAPLWEPNRELRAA
ncbi:hypothetical protein KIN34_14430 [Cellulomonas sp. DKR-3]|uniref:Replication-relaxation n=1 Tax=Cellulomonas fulva TaxID=2835530 RepID=A0ABS5U277_9CELL|nr:hypothetical protein [Cellulomonas fulva]MBT0995480.1 hypothetical protein [Cellulomonas fulva]